MGGAPPPRSDGAHSNPTLPHKATPIAQKIPQTAPPRPSGPQNPLCSSGFCGRSSECQTNVHLRQSLVHPARSATRPAGLGRSVRPMCVRRGVSWGVRAPYDLARDDHLLLPARRLAVLAAAALAIPIAGCGSSSDSSSSGGANDPAKAIPASAPFYLEATVRPTGQQRTDLEAALSKILRTNDPGAKITELIDKSGKEKGKSYAKDIEPWLGDKAAVAITGFAAGQPQFAVVINSTDDAKASDLINTDSSYKTKRSFEGTDYRYDPSDKTARGGRRALPRDRLGAVVQAGRAPARQGRRSRWGPTRTSRTRARRSAGAPASCSWTCRASCARVAGSAGSSLGPSELSAINSVFKRYRAFGVGIGADAQAIRLSVATLGGGSRRQRPGHLAPARQGSGRGVAGADAEGRRQDDLRSARFAQGPQLRQRRRHDLRRDLPVRDGDRPERQGGPAVMDGRRRPVR